MTTTLRSITIHGLGLLAFIPLALVGCDMAPDDEATDEVGETGEVADIDPVGEGELPDPDATLAFEDAAGAAIPIPPILPRSRCVRRGPVAGDVTDVCFRILPAGNPLTFALIGSLNAHVGTTPGVNPKVQVTIRELRLIDGGIRIGRAGPKSAVDSVSLSLLGRTRSLCRRPGPPPLPVKLRPRAEMDYSIRWADGSVTAAKQALDLCTSPFTL